MIASLELISVSVVVAFADGCAALITVTVIVPLVTLDGAVNNPVLVMLPALADQ
jgi:hypothetical protein